jgi:ABC-type proline/glycine betaine transport system substrate-binding protein
MFMNSKTIILLLSIAICLVATGCAKDQAVQPVRPTLIGVWSTAGQTWVIQNTDGVGYNVKYTAYTKGGVDYLHQVIAPAGIDMVYTVARLEDRRMVLVDTAGVELVFIRGR